VLDTHGRIIFYGKIRKEIGHDAKSE
jgi:hypothetical protein